MQPNYTPTQAPPAPVRQRYQWEMARKFETGFLFGLGFLLAMSLPVIGIALLIAHGMSQGSVSP